MLTLLSFLTALLALVTLLPMTRIQHWTVRGMDFPRLQISCIALLLLIAQISLLDLQHSLSWILITITGLCMLWQLCWILPYTRLWKVQVVDASSDQADQQISLLTANVLTPNRNAAALIELVNLHQPDILVTLESDKWWQEQLQPLETGMPYTLKCPLDNLYGMHVYSRLKLVEPEIRFLVEEDVPSMHAQVVMRCGDKVRVHFLHPAPPSPTENPESAERDAELIVVGRSVASSQQPVIVTGDLNDVAWSASTRLFRKISGLLDPRIGRGMFNTFHADYLPIRWPLDHLFHSEHFSLQEIARLPSIGSDHFPLLTRLTLDRPIKAKQDTPDTDTQDRERASEITEDQPVNESDVPEPGE